MKEHNTFEDKVMDQSSEDTFNYLVSKPVLNSEKEAIASIFEELHQLRLDVKTVQSVNEELLTINTQLLTRIMELESKKKKYSQPKPEIPKGFTHIKDFENKYKFCACTYLSSCVSDNKEAFSSVKLGGKRYVSEIEVIKFFESGQCNSKRIMKNYKDWKEYIPQLKALSKEAKQMIKDEKVNNG